MLLLAYESHHIDLQLKRGVGINQIRYLWKIDCNTLEDEFHFILECPLYQDLRAEYIKRYYWVRPNMPKFIELLKSENKTTINKLSVYIFKSFQKRNEIFYPA